MSQSPTDTPDPHLPIAVTMGDPAGIGLQTTALAWHNRAHWGVPPFVVFTDCTALKTHCAALGVDLPIATIACPTEAPAVFQNAIPVIPIPLGSPVALGETDTAHASATLRAIEAAVRATIDGETSAIVTNPITKATLTAAGFPHPGHTEFLGALAQTHLPDAKATDPVMMLAGAGLRVVPLTIHMPLCRVAATITTDSIIATVQTIAEALERDFAVSNPRIAVAGLNPHAGENATLGSEDRDAILPAVVRCRDKGLNVVGPLPADTMFHEAARKTYDAALCMYHDQALIPLKTLAFDRGVNITLGLPFVRTSPDHGTALDIVGSSNVSALSFIESLKAAQSIAQNRAAFQRQTDNREPATGTTQ